MSVADIPKEVLKELQKINDRDVFERILFRVDRLVQFVMAKERHRWSHLRSEDLQDIYQAACVGLCNGIIKVKPTDTPNQVILRIFAYIPANRTKFYTTEEKLTEEPVYRELESECLREVYHSLIVQGIITEQEYNLLCQRYVDGMMWKEIAARAHMNIDCVRKMVEEARLRMRHQLRLRSITAED